MNTRKFWPLDSELEGEIYENVAWDLPGFRRKKRPSRSTFRPASPRRRKN